MTEWLTPPVAVALMYTGVLPSLAIVYLLYEDRHRPGVLWFLALMTTAAVWALLYATFTLVQSPAVTLGLANFFWAAVPTVAVTMFLLAYEYVFRTVASRRLVAALFAPVVALFVLSWPNPANLVFTPEYHVGADGILYVPPLGGPVRVLVTQVYGFLLTLFAAGMFVGEALRTRGVRRRQTLYLLLVFVVLAATTLVKIAGLVPEYFDPTSVAFSVSGLVFAYSIRRHGLLKFAPVAREQAFQEVEEVILVVDPDDVVVDVNRAGYELFGDGIVGEPLAAVVEEPSGQAVDETIPTVEIDGPRGQQYFSWRTSSIAYGRALTGKLVVLSDVTALKRRQDELDLYRQILTRLFRHNMRNDLNIVEGYASRISETGDERFADEAEIIQSRARRLQGEAEKVRELEKALAYRDPVRLSLREEVDRVLAPYEGRSDVVVRSSVDDVTVSVHPQFVVALEELVENAVAHHDGRGRLEVDVSSEVTDDRVVLVVEDSGPGVPSAEIEVLDAEEETSLQHSSGIGLWLVKLVVTRLDGDLEIESGPEGTRIEIHLPRRGGDGGSP